MTLQTAGEVSSLEAQLHCFPLTLEDEGRQNGKVKNQLLASDLGQRPVLRLTCPESFSNRSIQRILRDVDNKDLSLSLKATPKEVADKVFKNMSSRAADMLREEIEFMGPVKIRDVEEAQQRIVNVIRNLEDKGEIVVARGGKGDEMIV